MRRWFLIMAILLLACRAVTPLAGGPLGFKATATLAPTAEPVAAPTEIPTEKPSAAPLTPTPTPASSPSAQSTEAPGSTATTPPETAFDVRFHPDGPLYVGDQVSMEVVAPQGMDLTGSSVRLEAPGALGERAATADFSTFGIGRRSQATLSWVWNTSGMTPGDYDLSFALLPDGPTWTETVALRPAGQAPPPEPQASWATAESDCCLVYYITGTAVERDLQDLLDEIDRQAADAEQRLSTHSKDAIGIVLLPRVLGHGGFASREIAVSYLDRNYAGRGSATVLHHEMIHILDSQLGGELRPTMLVEGLAVYLTGGHFKPEPILPRAAALLPPADGCTAVEPGKSLSADALPCGLDAYVPLVQLIDNFYFEQHEVGYMEAAALIQFMVDTWGWQAFSDFYRDIHPQPEGRDDVPEGGPQAEAFNAALQQHFELDIEQLEGRFINALRQQEPEARWVEDVQVTVAYYDTLRRYQELLDPSAYFLTAWLPDGQEMRKRGIVADFLRHPSRPANLALETMLVAVDAYIRDGDYAAAQELLAAVDTTLAEVAAGAQAPFEASALASDYLELVRVVQSAGYQPQQIDMQKNLARVWANASGPEMETLQLVRVGGQWQIVREASVYHSRTAYRFE